VKTLRRRYLIDDTPYPKVLGRLPTVLTVEEIQWLIAAACMRPAHAPRSRGRLPTAR
jgi:hypothetical protein